MNDIDRFNHFFSNLDDAITYVREKVANGTKIAGWTSQQGGFFRAPVVNPGNPPCIILFEDGEVADLTLATPWGTNLPIWKRHNSYAIIAQNTTALQAFKGEKFALPKESGSYYLQDGILHLYDEDEQSDELLLTLRATDCPTFRVYDNRKKADVIIR